MILLVDTSVIVKWFHEQGESEVEPARTLLAAHRRGDAQCLLLDLAAYELGNVMLRPLGRPPSEVREALALLLALGGPLVRPRPAWFATAAELGHEHSLTFYDACWAAAARELDCPLVTADRALLAAGLGISASQAAAALTTPD